MATEIESYVRASAQIDPVGNWTGQGIVTVARVSAGLFIIEVEDAFESRVTDPPFPVFQGEIDGVIQCANADGAATPLVFTYRMNTENQVTVAFYDATLALTDPGLFTFSMRIGNTETPLVAVL